MQLVKHFSSKQIMQQVIIATAPVFLTSFYLFGFSAILQISLAILTAICIDVLAAKVFKKDAWYFVSDYSSILTAILLALSISTLAPWWIVVVGVSFALIFAKYVYGGMGNNIFNPAMVGYVFLLISYPSQMASWQIPLEFISLGQVMSGLGDIDVLSGATLLDGYKNNLSSFENQDKTLYLAIAAIIGGVYLLARKIISWHIPVTIVIASSVTVLVINLFVDGGASAFFHLFAGGFFFAIFFIATDPVSTCATIKGRIIFAAIIGVLLIIIRIFGNYPDGIAFAVLFANMFVPLIDYYVKK